MHAYAGAELTWVNGTGSAVSEVLFFMGGSYVDYMYPGEGVTLGNSTLSYEEKIASAGGVGASQPHIQSMHPYCYHGPSMYPTFADIILNGTDGSTGRAADLGRPYNSSVLRLGGMVAAPQGALALVQIKGAYSSSLGLNTLTLVYTMPGKALIRLCAWTWLGSEEELLR